MENGDEFSMNHIGNSNTNGEDSSGSSEDEDYIPVVESSSDDDELSDHELASDDEERIASRRNLKEYKKFVPDETENEDLALSLVNEELAQSEGSDLEYAMISNSSSSDEFDVDEDRPKKVKKKVFYDPKCDHKHFNFVLGMRFTSAEEVRRAIQKVAIINGYNIKNVKSNKRQVQAKCSDGCPWSLYASPITSEGRFAIKSLNAEHRCHRDVHTRQVTADWIAREYIGTFRKNPNFTISQLADDILTNFAVQPTKWKLYRGKWKAMEMLRGSVTEHYASLRRYMAELQRVDREGRFEFQLQDDSVFRSFYVGFSALRKGFLYGCRPVLGFDACFLKTFLGGALLCATAKDGNNQMYPVAWAVVEAENEACWKWFLSILFEDLGINDGLGYTFMSDQQKGLINAIADLTPHAEHRNCARHVYMNWKKEFNGQELKFIFWRLVLSTHKAAYNIALDDLKAEDPDAYEDFLKRMPSRFCKAFISHLSKCDMIENNISETFNGYIVKARGKHIIDMLESIRSDLMKRQYEKLMQMSGVGDTICPRIKKVLESNKFKSRHCVTKPAVGERFQVTCIEDQFVVDLRNKTCTCRQWDIT